MKKITSKKLLNYGAMASALLGLTNANGQIIFTDIDDITLAPGDPAALIDLDGNSTVDFSALTLVTSSGDVAAAILPGMLYNFNSNAFIASTVYSSYNYPLNLTEGSIIDNTSPVGVSGTPGVLNFNSCAYSNSQFCNGVVDGYIGLVFKLEGNTHYGWVRVDISADVSQFTIKSYAYEATPDTAIEVGETLSLEDNTIEGFSSYIGVDNILTLNAKTPLEAITIHSLSGQEVLSQKLSNTTEAIDINALSSGIYITTVATNEKLQAFKIIKQ